MSAILSASRALAWTASSSFCSGRVISRSESVGVPSSEPSWKNYSSLEHAVLSGKKNQKRINKLQVAKLESPTALTDDSESPDFESDGEEAHNEVSAEKKLARKMAKEAKKKDILKEKEAATLKFVKYQGLGNDFLLVDNRDSPIPKVTPEQATALCNRNFGVGGDGVIFALPPKIEGSDYSMRIYNSDGSEPEMCGNGIRCMARFVADLESSQPRSYVIDTLAGPIVPELLEDGQVIVDMGPPILKAGDVPARLNPNFEGEAIVAAPLEVGGATWRVTCVSMGNPHCITFGRDGEQSLDVSALDLPTLGPLFENHQAFPARTNTEFVQVVSRSELKMRVWERGAGATLACGTGACALVVAAVLEGRADRNCLVHLPGGDLEIEWREETNHVYMKGPAEAVFSGKAFL